MTIIFCVDDYLFRYSFWHLNHSSKYIYFVEKGLQQSSEKLNSTPPLVFGFFYRIST